MTTPKEEKELMDEWLSSVSFTSDPGNEEPAPDPDDPDDDYEGKPEKPLKLSEVSGYTRMVNGKPVHVRPYSTKTHAQARLEALVHNGIRRHLSESAPVAPEVPPMYLTHADPQLQPIIKAQAEKLFADNPGLNRHVKAIKVQFFNSKTEAGKELISEGFRETGMSFSDVFGFQSLKDGTLFLNATHFGKMEKATFAAHAQPDGWFSVPVHTAEDLTREVMTHELGHSAATAWNRPDMDETLRNVMEDNDMITDETYQGTVVHVPKIMSALSEYAARSQDEFVAEAWTEFNLSSEPRPVAAKIGAMMRLLLSNKTSAPMKPLDGPLHVTVTGATHPILRFTKHLPDEVVWTWPSEAKPEWVADENEDTD